MRAFSPDVIVMVSIAEPYSLSINKLLYKYMMDINKIIGIILLIISIFGFFILGTAYTISSFVTDELYTESVNQSAEDISLEKAEMSQELTTTVSNVINTVVITLGVINLMIFTAGLYFLIKKPIKPKNVGSNPKQ